MLSHSGITLHLENMARAKTKAKSEAQGDSDGYLQYLTESRVSIALSFVAIVVSIVSPFVGYYLLVPQLQEFHNRPKLDVSSGIHTILIPADANVANARATTTMNTPVVIRNDGNLPARNLEVVFRYSNLNDGETPPLVVTSYPPLNLESKLDGTNIRVSVKTPIAPDETVTITPPSLPDQIWVYTEYGESHSINKFDLRNPKTNIMPPIHPVR